MSSMSDTWIRKRHLASKQHLRASKAKREGLRAEDVANSLGKVTSNNRWFQREFACAAHLATNASLESTSLSMAKIHSSADSGSSYTSVDGGRTTSYDPAADPVRFTPKSERPMR